MASHHADHPLPAPPPQGQQQYYGQQQQHQGSYQSQLPQLPPAAQYPQTQQPYPVPQYQQAQPQTQERPRPESRKSRAFSFRSDKSQKTDKTISGGVYKINSSDLHETSKEKESKRLHSKADPTMAMNEAEPSAVAQTAANHSIHAPIRSIQHKDATGAPIADPDRSNPTRNRWERPLDTIRSFEAAIDGGYNRKSIYGGDAESVARVNRRSSYFANNGPPRFPQDSYYGGRPTSTIRPESTMYDPRGSAPPGPSRDSYFESYEGGPYGGGNMNSQKNRYSRVQSDPHMSARAVPNKNLYPIPNNHRSYETVASASGNSGSLGEPSGYQTDPTSSENSSIDRRSPPKRQDPANDYGISFGQTQVYQPPSLAVPASQPRTLPPGPSGPPPVPRKDVGGSLLRKGSKFGVAGSQPQAETGDKRKSWLSRRFSKLA